MAEAAEGGPVFAAVFAFEGFDGGEFVWEEFVAEGEGGLELAGFEDEGDDVGVGEEDIVVLVLLDEVEALDGFGAEVDGEGAVITGGTHDADPADFVGVGVLDADELGFVHPCPWGEPIELVGEVVEARGHGVGLRMGEGVGVRQGRRCWKAGRDGAQLGEWWTGCGEWEPVWIAVAPLGSGAGEAIRTPDINLGKVALYP